MRRFFIIAQLLALFAAGCQCALAQRIAYGERTPKIKERHAHWLDGRTPEQSDYVFIGFIYSRSNTCREFCFRLDNEMRKMEHPVQVILVTREPADMIDPHLRDFIDGHTGIISDESGRIFRDFGIRYVPFGVLVDRKRHALWFGNPLTADRDFFKNRASDRKGKKHKR